MDSKKQKDPWIPLGSDNFPKIQDPEDLDPCHQRNNNVRRQRATSLCPPRKVRRRTQAR